MHKIECTINPYNMKCIFSYILENSHVLYYNTPGPSAVKTINIMQRHYFINKLSIRVRTSDCADSR